MLQLTQSKLTISFSDQEVLDYSYYDTSGGRSVVMHSSDGSDMARIEAQEEGYGVSWITDMPAEVFRQVISSVIELGETTTEESGESYLRFGVEALTFTWGSPAYNARAYKEIGIGGTGKIDLDLARSLFSQTAAPVIQPKSEEIIGEAGNLLQN